MDDLTAASQVWRIMVREGQSSAEAWQSWAQAEISRRASPPVWLIELLDAQSPEDAVAALSAVNDSQSCLDEVSFLLGMAYQRHLSGGADLVATLQYAGDVSDRANYDHPSCEAIYALLSKLEDSELQASSTELKRRVAGLFAPHLAYFSACIAFAGGFGTPMPAPQQ